MWIYRQSTGRLERDGEIVATGYSGNGSGKNNPEAQQLRGVGPIPAGVWLVSHLRTGQTEHGPYVLQLVAAPDTDSFGRSGFLIHGDSIKRPGEASKGCIILGRAIRETIWNSQDHTIKVTA